MRFFAWEKHVIKQRKMTADHKEQTSPVNDFSSLLHLRRCRNLGSLKFVLGFSVHILTVQGSVYPKLRTLPFFSILNSPRGALPLSPQDNGVVCTFFCPLQCSGDACDFYFTCSFLFLCSPVTLNSPFLAAFSAALLINVFLCWTVSLGGIWLCVSCSPPIATEQQKYFLLFKSVWSLEFPSQLRG